jgi:cytochrome c oxidase cbb3-type subunit 4
METYSLFRQIADSWVLLAMFVFFGGCVAWAFRPGSGATHADAASVIFRSEDKPACPKNCPDCSCNSIPEFVHD